MRLSAVCHAIARAYPLVRPVTHKRSTFAFNHLPRLTRSALDCMDALTGRPIAPIGRARTSAFVLLGLLIATTTLTVSCRRRVAPTQKGDGVASAFAASNATTPPRSLPPLQASNRVESVVVRGHPDATLLVPIGVTTVTPLVAILVPTADRMRQRCESLGQAIAANHFVLCQSAQLAQQSMVPAAAGDGLVESALRAAVRNTKIKYGRYVSSKELALIGIGEGADAVAPIVRHSPEFFPRVALLDGGFTFWSSVDSTRFVAAGAKAFLARCTDAHCRNEAMRVVATVKTSGIATRLDPEPRTRGVAGGPGALPTPVDELLKWLLSVDSAPKGAHLGPSESSSILTPPSKRGA